MSTEQLFTREQGPAEEHHRWRLWFADVLELLTAALLGWGAVRGLEVEGGAGTRLVAMAVAWALTSLAGGLTGRTFWRQVLGVRLATASEAAPGIPRAMGRILTVPVDVLVAPVLQYRPFDKLLGLHAVRTEPGFAAWARGFAWQAPWLLLMGLAVYFLVTPTRKETLVFLGTKLPGWHCCNGTKRAPRWQCPLSLSRLVRDARRGDAESLKVAADCPVAAERLQAR
ncbi:hypothetical protein P2318_33120 [Myxococcaceae bacterium GXIMD 01537]